MEEPCELTEFKGFLARQKIQDDVNRKNLMVWTRFIRDLGCYTWNKSFVLAEKTIALMTKFERDVPMKLPSGEARRTFRMMPESQCKEYARGRLVSAWS